MTTFLIVFGVFFVATTMVFNLLYWWFVYHKEYPNHPWHPMVLIGPIPYVDWAFKHARRRREERP